MISKRSALQPVGGASLVQDPHYQVAFDNSAHMEYQTRIFFFEIRLCGSDKDIYDDNDD